MKRTVTWSLLMLVVLVGATLKYTQSASSSSVNQHIAVPRAVPETSNLIPAFATTFDVDRTDDTAAATACTVAPNDCSLRGAIIAANADVTATPVVINLAPGTTYNLTLTNATQENAAATGDLDITTALHAVTIAGGGNTTIIDASGLTSGNMRDRAFHITGSGVIAIFQDLVIQNGKAADDGTSGMSTDPTAQNANRFGGGILNNSLHGRERLSLARRRGLDADETCAFRSQCLNKMVPGSLKSLAPIYSSVTPRHRAVTNAIVILRHKCGDKSG
jgi:hypothetical protein